MKNGNKIKRKSIKFNIENEIELFNNIKDIFSKHNFIDKNDNKEKKKE